MLLYIALTRDASIWMRENRSFVFAKGKSLVAMPFSPQKASVVSVVQNRPLPPPEPKAPLMLGR